MFSLVFPLTLQYLTVKPPHQMLRRRHFFTALLGLVGFAPGCQNGQPATDNAPDSATLALNTALAEATAATCANRMTILAPDGQAPNYEPVDSLWFVPQTGCLHLLLKQPLMRGISVGLTAKGTEGSGQAELFLSSMMEMPVTPQSTERTQTHIVSFSAEQLKPFAAGGVLSIQINDGAGRVQAVFPGQ